MTPKAGHTFTAGPWDYVAGTEHHGPYVAGPFGDICDCYAMSNPMAASVRNGGTSYPINHQGEAAEANARLIAEAGTVAHETGLTPRQLVEQRDELLGIVIDWLAVGNDMKERRSIRERARAAIAKATAGGAV